MNFHLSSDNCLHHMLCKSLHCDSFQPQSLGGCMLRNWQVLLGPTAQHWTAYVWMRQHLRETRSAPKAVLAHAAPARGHRPCIKAGATKRVLLTREYSLHCCIRRQMHKGCRGVLRPARRNCRQTVRCKVRRYSWSVS